MKRIPIFYAVDDNYINVITVSIHSLIKNASKERKYSIYILHTGLSNESKNKLLKLKNKRFNIYFFNVTAQIEILAKKLNVRDYYTLTTYYRLIVPNAFPYIDKALYLDSDTLIRGDIATLYDTEIGDNILGAIKDGSVQIFDEFITYVEKALKIKKECYFNAGVLIMNLAKMRKMRFENIISELVKKVSFKVAQDQDLLNVVCKDQVYYLDDGWNQMPLGTKNQFPRLIHYNLIFKPWKLDDVMYEDFFWNEAVEAGVKDDILAFKNTITKEQIEAEKQGVEKVKELCLYEVSRKTYYKESLNYLKELTTPEREQVLKRIHQYEVEGKFDVDAENDPPYRLLKPGDVDYLKKRTFSKFKTFSALNFAHRFFNKLIKQKKIIIDGVEGIEYLKACKSGAIITANHFNPFDSIPLNKVMKKYVRKKKLFTVIREGNYTFPGIYGYIMRNCNTLPIASDLDLKRQFLNAVDTILKRGDFILIYPEQSLWWNYRKPKPTKNTAFKFAVKNHVPVIPTFITMRDSEYKDENGYPVQAYTLHILPPIYPDKDLSEAENVMNIKNIHDQGWKDIYEGVYQTDLVYETK